jgi:hypothetical protein
MMELRVVRGLQLLARRFSLPLILALGFAVQFPFLLNNAFLSDESVYTYAAYAIAKGIVPYKQIVLAHPPVGFTIMAPVMLFAIGNLLAVRTFGLLMLLLLSAMSYRFYKSLPVSNSSRSTRLIAVALLSLYPIPFALSTPIQFLIFDILIIGALISFTYGLQRARVRYFLAAGFVLGLALMDWYPALFAGISILGFLWFYGLRNLRQPFAFLWRSTAALLLGGLVSTSFILGIITISGGFNNFFLQTVALQSNIRYEISLNTRIDHILSGVEGLLPLTILAFAGMAETLFLARKATDRLSFLPLWFFSTNFLLISVIPRVVFSHYFDYLTPFMAYLGAIPIHKLQSAISTRRRIVAPTTRRDFLQAMLGFSMILILFVAPAYAFAHGRPFQNDAYNVAEESVGMYVSSITLPNESIWTSEAGIGYFASRLIQAPNSSSWPFQGTYNDIFNASFVDLDGILQHGYGAVSTAQFAEAWQIHQTRVLVFIFGIGPVPYPDTLLWFGFPGDPGVASWVRQNYSHRLDFTFPKVNYTYAVWTRT